MTIANLNHNNDLFRQFYYFAWWNARTLNAMARSPKPPWEDEILVEMIQDTTNNPTISIRETFADDGSLFLKSLEVERMEMPRGLIKASAAMISCPLPMM